ncbi:hypothetical protein KSS87_001996, partial [Heliosperma pusillum]
MDLLLNQRQSGKESFNVLKLLLRGEFLRYGGLKLELCTTDRPGLLSDVTRMFRENSLTVVQVEVSTRGGKAINTFYVRDASGYHVDAKTIESIRQAIGLKILKVKGSHKERQPASQSQSRFLFG